MDVFKLGNRNCFQFTPILCPQLASTVAAIPDTGALVSLVSSLLVQGSAMEFIELEPVEILGIGSTIIVSVAVKFKDARLLRSNNISIQLSCFVAYVVDDLPVELIISKDVMEDMDPEIIMEAIFPLEDDDVSFDNIEMSTEIFSANDEDLPQFSKDLGMYEEWNSLIREFTSIFKDGVATKHLSAEPYTIKLTRPVLTTS